MEFPTPIKSSVRWSPVLNDAKTAVQYIEGIVTVEMIVTEHESPWNPNADGKTVETRQSSVEPWLMEMIHKLNRVRLNLVFDAQGIGPVRVYPDTAYDAGNPPDGLGVKVKDVKGGPTPRVLAWRPLSINRAAAVAWECSFHLTPDQYMTLLTGGSHQFKHQILDFSYHRKFNLVNGLVTITTTGFVQAMPRVLPVQDDANMRNVAGMQSAESLNNRTLRTFVTKLFKNDELPHGFRQTLQFDESNDGTRLDFLHTEEEIESDNPFQKYMIDMDIDHDVSSELLNKDATKGAGMRSWENTLSGTINIPKGIPRVFTFYAFMEVFNQRVNEVRKATAETDSYFFWISSYFTGKTPVNFFVTKLSIKEPIYKRSMTFMVKWVTVHELKDMFRMTGLFTPVPNLLDNNGNALPEKDQWQFWQASIETYARNPYGSQRLISLPIKGYFTPDNFNQPGTPASPATEVLEQTTLPTPIPTRDPYEKEQTLNAGIAANKSWVHYESRLLYQQENEVIPYNRVQDVPLSEVKNEVNSGSPPTLKADSGFRIGNRTASLSTGQEQRNAVVHNRGRFYVTCVGQAVRVGHAIPAPTIEKIGNLDAIPVGKSHFEHTRIGTAVDQPVYLCRWNQTYTVNGDIYNQDISKTVKGTVDPAIYT
jgi:hypothetical protein